MLRFPCLFLFLCCTLLPAAVPTTIAHQGLLRDANGARLEGSVNLQFALYASAEGGSALWEESATVQAQRGIFSHQLGSTSALDPALFASGSLWLELRIDGVAQSPRQFLNSVPYALSAGSVSNGSLSPLAYAQGSPVLFSSAQPPTGFFSSGLRLDTSAWRSREGMPSGAAQPLWNAGTAVINSVLYVVGGYQRSGTSNVPQNNLERFDISSGTWLSSLSVPQDIAGTRAVAHQGRLWIIGGTDGSVLDTVRVFDPSDQSWDMVAPLPAPRRNVYAGVINNRLHVVGGTGSDSLATNTHWVYNPDSNAWDSLAPLPVALFSGCAASDGSTLYVLGGFVLGEGSAGHRPVYAYQNEEAGWQMVAQLPDGKISAGAACLDDGLLYVMGGESTGAVSPDTLILDPASGTWSYGPRLSDGRSQVMVASNGSSLFCLGGLKIYAHASPSGAFGTWYFSLVESWTPAHLWVHTRQE